MTMMSTAPRTAIATRPVERRPACLDVPQLFQHHLLEDSPAVSSLSSDERRTAALLQRQAEERCLACPLLTGCLHDAVVRHDVAGYVAGTTHRQRLQMRARLGIDVEPEDLDTLAGVTASNRQVSHAEVVRLRNANPHESLETIAMRLGCSLSTVKRHLRKARTETVVAPTVSAPTHDDVMDAYVAVTTRSADPARSTDPARAA